MKLSEKLIIEEATDVGVKLQQILIGLSIGYLISIIRKQLKMSQRALAKRAGLPQSTISSIERSKKQPNLSTLKKVLNAMFCDLLIVPILRDSIENLLIGQAKSKAEKHVRYLLGSMNLEKQKPDAKLANRLLKKEIDELINSSKLWE